MKKLFYLFAILFAIAFAACEGTEPPTSNKVETGASENITQTSATLKGVVNVDIADYNSVEFGVMYDTLLAEVNNRSAQMVKGSVLQGKDFKVDVAGLTANTKYFYCAYLLLNGIQYEYGAVKEFTALAHAYVDLGLSVKWATCNVGANSPEDYGYYFAWGETQPKEVYDWSTYKWTNVGYHNFTKYCIDPEYGTVDYRTVLELADDAANANWGGAWRMPTIAEQDELREECIWTWTTKNGVNGYTVTSRANGNSIFLPAAGSRAWSKLYEPGIGAGYWSSSLSTYNPSQALEFGFFYGEEWESVHRDQDHRHVGHVVRPVIPNSLQEYPNNTTNGYEYVDLGLSVKWATCNVGANSPEEYGDYFAWGETQPQPKEVYDWGTYKWSNGMYDNFTKYCTDSEYGTVDYRTVLEPADDAANANWGGSWRMPTVAEQTELRTNCTWTWTTQNGVNGYTITSRTNGNSIFLPAAGRRIDSDLYGADGSCLYWSSSASTLYAYDLDNANWNSHERIYGQTVRPVLP